MLRAFKHGIEQLKQEEADKIMRTRLIEILEDNIDFGLLEEAGEIVRKGGLVAFPTETVYGLGGDGLNPESSAKIYAAKGRPSDNPLIVHISELGALDKIVREIPPVGKRLAQAFWPGPLTMIYHKSDLVPGETTGGLDTVAVRMPRHRTALAFIRAAGGYVAAPSANLSGKPSPTLAKYVAEDMDGRIDMIIDGGGIEIGLESTILDLTEEVPVILRPGFITVDMLESLIGPVRVDRAILEGGLTLAPKAPGMKYKHYAPKGELTVVSGSREAVREKINALSAKQRCRGSRVGIIGTEENIPYYEADSVKSAGNRGDERAIARRLYRILREFDEEDITVIYAEAFSDIGMGQAIMNRLLKAAGHKVIQL